MKKTTWLLAALLALAGCSVNASGPDQPATAKPAASSPVAAGMNDTSEKAPEFDLPNVYGGSMTSAALKGKVVVVDFWQTDCGPCITEIPEYNALYQKYKDKGVEFVGVTLESGSADEIKQKTLEFQMKYPVVVGDEKIADGFGGIIGTPTTFVLSKDWTVHHKYLGNPPGKKESLEKDLQDLLASGEAGR